VSCRNVPEHNEIGYRAPRRHQGGLHAFGQRIDGNWNGGIGARPERAADAGAGELLRDHRRSNSAYFKISDLKKLGCQPLWEVRNWIYKENGLCFKTPKAIKAFGNAGCLYDDVTAVPLNQFEQYNVKAIRKVEAQKGCS
jgi:YARHG domain